MSGGLQRRVFEVLRDSRGLSLITAVFVVFAIGMMLFGFQFISQSEAVFAAANRASTIALHLAEAGIQEAQARLNAFGGTPGTTCFTSSLVAGGSCSGNTPQSNAVALQATLSTDATLFPIMSAATFGGATRVVRVIEQAVLQTGFSNVILAPQVTFQGDASPTIGDVYSRTSVVFASPSKSPVCANGTSPTNLLTPEVVAGTYVNGGSGPNMTCGSPVITVTANPFTAECATGNQEVAPTSCARQLVGGQTVPAYWHPQTPIGMSLSDFTIIINAWHTGGAAWPANVALQLSVVNAQQGGTDVSYTPNTYTPSYWATSGTTNKVLLVVAKQPFCVDPVGLTVSLPSSPSASCPSGQDYYGSYDTIDNACAATGNSCQTRYLDWGLVSDDLGRRIAQTFFQTPQCSSCADPGNQNGIRYVPLLPTINVAGQACKQLVNPGTNVFDKVNQSDGITCASPPTTTINSSNVSFSGTKSSQEALIIDNATTGTIVHISGSVNGSSTLNCSNTNFNIYNWGIIMATGDIDIAGNTVFSGFIYTPGNVQSHGNTLIQGGIFSANVQSGQVSVDTLGTVNFCAGTNATVPMSPLFFTFKGPIAWLDRPADRP